MRAWAVVHQPGEGERHSAGCSSEVVIKAAGEDTAGSFFVSEATIEPGFPGRPAHRHEKVHDIFYVLDGTLTIRLGDETRELGPGTFVCVSPGVAHNFANKSEAAVRFLNFNTRPRLGAHMRDLAEAARSGPLTSERIGQVASRYYSQTV